jgi:hypothetical protein
MRQHLALVVVMIAVVNGVLSPVVVVVAKLLPTLLPGWALTSPEVQFYLASLVLSSITLIVSGLPAALFERLTGAEETTGASYAIWIGAASFLSLPSLGRLLAGA